jgi:hypothetical protein
MVCFATFLKAGAVNQMINAINFEEIQACRAIEIILRNERSKGHSTATGRLGSMVYDGIMEKGHVEDGEVDGRDCLIHG